LGFKIYEVFDDLCGSRWRQVLHSRDPKVDGVDSRILKELVEGGFIQRKVFKMDHEKFVGGLEHAKDQ
jgi:hypothetical protein